MKSLVSGAEVLPASSLSTDIESTVCITGHRMKRIIPYMNDSGYADITFSVVKLMLYRYIDMAVEAGYRTFINGLADGTDLWSAEYVIMKKKRNSDIRLVSVMPFMRHAEFMHVNERRKLAGVERASDSLVTVCTDPGVTYSRFSGNLYKDRNYFMVDRSGAVIAFADSTQKQSGTYQTINYAYRQNRKICSFSADMVYDIIESSYPDIRKMAHDIALLENVFST